MSMILNFFIFVILVCFLELTFLKTSAYALSKESSIVDKVSKNSGKTISNKQSRKKFVQNKKIVQNNNTKKTAKKNLTSSVSTPLSNKTSNRDGLSTDINFNDQTVSGKYETPFESQSTIENEKPIDDLIGVRKNFHDRIKKSKTLETL